MLVAVLVAMGLFALSAASIAAQDTTGTPSTPAVTPAPDAPRLELEFEELNDSGVSGTATLYESGDQTIVELSLEDTGENHPAHIHAGSCDDLQPEPEYPLQNVGTEGRSTSVVDASLADLTAGDFAIDLHLSPNELGTLIVCANIEGEPVVPTAAGTPGDTPGTPPTVAATQAATQSPQPTAPTQAATQTPQPTATQTPQPTATQAVTEPPQPTATQAATETPQPTATQSPQPAPTQPPAPTAAPTQVAQTPQPLVVVATRTLDAAIAAATRAREAVVPPETVGDQTVDATEPAVTSTPEEAEATADPANAPDGTGGAVNGAEGAASAPLPSIDDLDVDGTVVLTMLDADTTRISVMLSGDAVTSDAIVHLHDGTCDTPGDFTLELDPPDAEGLSETDVDLSLDALLGDDYFINVHQSEAAYDTLLVCGELAGATVGMVMPESPTPKAGTTIVITPESTTTPTAPPADTPPLEPTTAPVEQAPAAEPTAVPDTLTPAAGETPAAEATTVLENETPVAGKTITTTPEPTETPTAPPATAQGGGTGDGTSGDVTASTRASGKGSPVQPAGDGTSGDVSDSSSASSSASGNGFPVNPTTGLPQATGTGPMPTGNAAAIERAAWLSGALALLALGAGIRVRRAETRRSRSVRTTTSRHPSRWTLPDI